VGFAWGSREIQKNKQGPRSEEGGRSTKSPKSSWENKTSWEGVTQSEALESNLDLRVGWGLLEPKLSRGEGGETIGDNPMSQGCSTLKGRLERRPSTNTPQPEGEKMIAGTHDTKNQAAEPRRKGVYCLSSSE